jgi:hypothetical protein
MGENRSAQFGSAVTTGGRHRFSVGSARKRRRAEYRLPPHSKTVCRFARGGVIALAAVGVLLSAVSCAPLCGTKSTCAFHGDSGWTFENAILRVAVNDAMPRGSVLDKRCGRIWAQPADTGARGLISVMPLHDASGVEVALSCPDGTNAPLPLTMRLSLGSGQVM